MKKLLSIALILSFVIGLVSFLPAMAQEAGPAPMLIRNPNMGTSTPDGLEKIPAPNMMQMFRNIVKRGTALFGIRKEIKNEVKEGDVSTSTALKLEKILAPQYIGMYERIQKIGNSLWGYKKGGNKNEKPLIFKAVTSDEASCVTTAIGVKDSALISNNSTFTAELNSAISARTACQTIAISSTENQRQNNDNCIKTFQNTLKEARKKANDAHKNAWKTYTDSLKSCRPSLTATSTVSETAELIVADGGGSITEAGASQE